MRFVPSGRITSTGALVSICLVDLMDDVFSAEVCSHHGGVCACFPEPYLLTGTENKIIDDMLELLTKHGLTSHQSRNLLERLGQISTMRQRVAKGPRIHKEGYHGIYDHRPDRKLWPQQC